MSLLWGTATAGDFSFEAIVARLTARLPRRAVVIELASRRRPVAADLRQHVFSDRQRLRPLERVGLGPDGHALWRCVCSCPEGTVVPAVPSSDLVAERVTSCGCRRREVARERARAGIRRRAA